MHYILSFLILSITFLSAETIEVIDYFETEKPHKKIIDNNDLNKKKSQMAKNKLNKTDTQDNKDANKTDTAEKKQEKKENYSKKKKIIDLEKKKEKKEKIKITPSKSSIKKAKLIIIIDDISHKYQLNNIKSLGIKINPSIFPPSNMNMRSNNLAKNVKHYLIHLPMESGSATMNKMHKTLLISNSKKEIIQRVKEIRKLFPTVKFVNNHTGSKFSKNYNKSKILYKALMDNGFKFVDSRTTYKSKFYKISKEFNRKYIKNDIFIDNKLNTQATVKKIKEGIRLAKKHGIAVIIGHPHPTTFKALKLSKKHLNSVNVVYLDEIY